MNAVSAWGLGFVSCFGALALLGGCDDGAGVVDGPLDARGAVDAGLDGAPDAAPPDAEPPGDLGDVAPPVDAAPDADPSDAAPSDADAPGDLAPPDADPTDATPADATPADADPPDASPPDAAPMCGPELCNGLDDDCDGATDEGFDLGPCTVGLGACAAEGQRICDGPEAARCDAAPGAPADEVCDGVDDDCDGAVDEEIAAPPCYDGPPETRGVGACRDGRLRCVGGALTCRGAVLPAAERCDGIDHDCDGAFPAANVRFVERSYPDDPGILRGLVVADADGDGDIDLVTMTGDPDRPGGVWYANDGAGVFGPANVLPALPDTLLGGTFALAVGELTGNDRPDLVLFAEPRGALYPNFALGREPRAILPELGALRATAVAVEDVDGDGSHDVVFATPGGDGSALYITRGDGAGGLGPPDRVPLPERADAILVHDFDGDGAVDLLVPTRTGGGTVLVRGGPGGPQGPAMVVGDGAVEGSVGVYLLRDLDGNGRLDLAFAEAHDTLRRAPIQPGPVIGQGRRLAFEGGITGIAAGQFDCDPGLELVVTTLDDTWIIDDPIALDGLRPLGGGSDQRGLAVADLDGDGLDDIVHAVGREGGPLVRLQRR